MALRFNATVGEEAFVHWRVLFVLWLFSSSFQNYLRLDRKCPTFHRAKIQFQADDPTITVQANAAPVLER